MAAPVVNRKIIEAGGSIYIIVLKDLFENCTFQDHCDSLNIQVVRVSVIYKILTAETLNSVHGIDTICSSQWKCRWIYWIPFQLTFTKRVCFAPWNINWHHSGTRSDHTLLKDQIFLVRQEVSTLYKVEY